MFIDRARSPSGAVRKSGIYIEFKLKPSLRSSERRRLVLGGRESINILLLTE
jgi:hypothetical protein